MLCLPKRLLNAPDVILAPIPLRDFLLPDGHPAPAHPHDRDVIHVVLVEVDLEAGVVLRGPLVKPPALHNLGWLNELKIFACYVAAEELELSALLGALEELWSGASESGDALGVGEGLV